MEHLASWWRCSERVVSWIIVDLHVLFCVCSNYTFWPIWSKNVSKQIYFHNSSVKFDDQGHCFTIRSYGQITPNRPNIGPKINKLYAVWHVPTIVTCFVHVYVLLKFAEQVNVALRSSLCQSEVVEFFSVHTASHSLLKSDSVHLTDRPNPTRIWSALIVNEVVGVNDKLFVF